MPDKADYTADEKLSIYREHKKLTRALEVIPSGSIYQFTLRVGQEGLEGQIQGTVTTSGK
jgi:hypothetical protein